MLTRVHHRSSLAPDRAVALAAAIGGHLLLGWYALEHGIIRVPSAQSELPSLQVNFRTEPRQRPPEQSMPMQPTLSTPLATPHPVAPTVVFDLPEDSAPLVDVPHGLTVPPVAGTVAPPRTPQLTPLGQRARRSTDEFYPAASIRMGEQGAAIVRVCVDAAGGLAGAPVIERSSGHTRLDAAAIAWAREGAVYTPATADGAAVAACRPFRVNFRLRQ